jgi:hypothetical protein
MSVVEGALRYNVVQYSWGRNAWEYKGLSKYNIGDTIIFVVDPSQQDSNFLESLKNDKEFDIHYISPKAHNKNHYYRSKDQGNIVVIGTKKAVE